jgi:hypothetical protein
MNFYKRSSVGRYSQEEQMILEAIQRLMNEKNFPLDKIPTCYSLDDLIEVKLMLENYSEAFLEASDQKLVEMDIAEDENLLDENFEQIDSKQEQMERQSNDLRVQQEQDQKIDISEVNILKDELQFENIHESEVGAKSAIKTDGKTLSEYESDDFISNDYNPFADPIVERSYTQAQGNIEQENLEEEPLELEDANPSTLADLPPHTKRKAAEQTADTLLKGYAQFAPMPFIWMAKLPESKIEKMAFDGEIDLSIEVSEGLTFDDYMKQTNEQVDEIFEVDKDTLSDIREPLIEVLMEQNMELTPTQRLMAAVISHLAQMFTVAMKLRQQNNRILSYQKNLTFLSNGAKVA